MTLPKPVPRIIDASALVPLSIVVTLLFSPLARPQVAHTLPALSADQVVEHLMDKTKERAQGLQHYVGRRSYRLEYRGFPASTDATMEVEISFDAPASKHFTIINATGSKLIQNRVFRKLLEGEEQASDAGNRSHTELSPANYRFTLAGTDGENYILSVDPRTDSRFLYRGRIWVNGNDFAVTRIEAQPARNPSFWTTQSAIHHTYQKVDGEFYLPKENKTVTSVRLGGVATLSIEYESYQVVAAKTRATVGSVIAPGASGTVLDTGMNEQVANLFSGRR